MSYFVKYPHIFYSFNEGENVIVRDITTRVTLPQDVLSTDALYQDAVINSGEMPEDVSYRLYKSTQYHWIIMLVNQIIEPSDWPMSYADVEEYANELYENPYGVHHYEDADGNWATSGTTITNLEYEQTLNEEKRLIRVIRPDLISVFVSEFNNLMKESG